MSILDKINGRLLVWVGVIIALPIIEVLMKDHEPLQAVLGLIMATFLTIQVSSRVQNLLTRVIRFARVPAWPEYVLLVVAAIISTKAGSWHSAAFIAALGIIGAGLLFDSLY